MLKSPPTSKLLPVLLSLKGTISPSDKVPHPPITQTLDMLGFKRQGDPDVIFIHLNHTNPVYDKWGEEHTQVVEMGWKIGKQGMKFSL